MDKYEVAVLVFLGENFAIVVVEPGMDRVLIEHRVFYLQLELIAQKRVAAAGVDHNSR